MSDNPYADVRAVYAILKQQMQECGFPPEHYVAIVGGKMVADSDSLEELRQKVRALGLDEAKVMFDQVGYDMLEFREYIGWIMMNAAVDYWVECLLPVTNND